MDNTNNTTSPNSPNNGPFSKVNTSNTINNASAGAPTNSPNKPADKAVKPSTESGTPASNTKSISYGVISILALAVLVFGIFSFSKNGSNEENDSIAGPGEEETSDNGQALKPAPFTPKTSSNSSLANASSAVATSNQIMRISDGDARVIALTRAPGRITDLREEKNFGTDTYVVEIRKNNGDNAKVTISIYTGQILAFEE